MARTTINQVNKALKAAGIDAELLRGEGYFYFSGKAMDVVQEQGVYGVYRLNELSVERWVAEAQGKIKADEK